MTARRWRGKSSYPGGVVGGQGNGTLVRAFISVRDVNYQDCTIGRRKHERNLRLLQELNEKAALSSRSECSRDSLVEKAPQMLLREAVVGRMRKSQQDLDETCDAVIASGLTVKDSGVPEGDDHAFDRLLGTLLVLRDD